MKLLLNVKEDNAAEFLNMLQSLSYVKYSQLEDIHFDIIQEAVAIVDDVHRIERGELEGRDAHELLDEILEQNKQDD